MLYGGSVDEKNAGAYLALPVIDGLLVGGASSDLKKMSAFTKAIARHG
jgi:triosephosphate isomerase